MKWHSLCLKTTKLFYRIAGSDRYQTGQMVVSQFLEPNNDLIYLATGRSYLDSLVAAPLAAKNQSGILLIDGTQTKLSADWFEFVYNHNLTRYCLLGGSQAITTEIEAQLRHWLTTGSPN